MSDIFLLFFFRGNPPVQVGSEMVDEEILGTQIGRNMSKVLDSILV